MLIPGELYCVVDKRYEENEYYLFDDDFSCGLNDKLATGVFFLYLDKVKPRIIGNMGFLKILFNNKIYYIGYIKHKLFKNVNGKIIDGSLIDESF